MTNPKNQKKSILIVDDDESILNTFTRILRKQGYDIDTAETGQETMEKLKDQTYDLILIDLRLPDTNGADLLSKIHTSHPKTKKIAFTGYPSVDDATKALDHGAAAYLVKPIKPEELIKLIAEKLKN